MTHSPDLRSVRSTSIVTALVVALSWGVRAVVERQLALGESVSLLGAMVRFSRGENSGVAFGLLRGSPLVPWLSLAAVMLLAIVAAQQRSRVTSVASGMILGGGLANVIDRIDDGRVTDYIDVTVGAWHYPTFNLPDVAITIGVVILLGALVPSNDREQADIEPDTRQKSALGGDT